MKVFFLAAAMVGGLAAQQVITDLDVIRMVQAGVAEDVILKVITGSPGQFSAQPDHIVAWKKAAVPDQVTRAMMARARDGSRIQYVPFSSEVRVMPPKRGGRRWTHLKIW